MGSMVCLIYQKELLFGITTRAGGRVDAGELGVGAGQGEVLDQDDTGGVTGVVDGTTSSEATGSPAG